MTELSPIDYAVISQALIASAREMGVKLIRSAYSTILREARDGSAGLMDRHGNTVAQAELIPMQLGPIGETLRACLRRHPVETLKEGDFLINNDPFEGGQHIPDVFIFTPIFVEGRVVGFGASVAHHLDLGGGAPGLNIHASRRLSGRPALPAQQATSFQHDWNGGSFERLVTANVRVPDLTIGDFNAQFAANAIGVLRVRQLCERYGADKVEAAMKEMQDYSERRVRAAIAQAPKGTFYGEDAVDDDGLTDEPLVVKAKVTIADDSVEIDFEGTCTQVKRNLNCPYSSTLSAALSCVKSVLTSPDIPYNEGMARPIRIKVPYGSLLNPRPPAPVRARMIPAYRVFNAVMKAMAQALPDKVIATGFDCTTAFCLSRLGEKGYSVYLEIFGGGYGASKDADGCDAVDSPLSNCSNAPVESLDIDYDFFRIVGYELAPDSFGLGARRGGAGFTRRCEILKDDVQLAIYSDRFRLAPEGLQGGEPGQRGYCRIHRANGTVEELKQQGRRRSRQGRRRRDVRGRWWRLRPYRPTPRRDDRPRLGRRPAHARPARSEEAGGGVAALRSLLLRLRTDNTRGRPKSADNGLRLVRDHRQKNTGWPVGQHPALLPIAHRRDAEAEAGRELRLAEFQTAPQNGDVRHRRHQLRSRCLIKRHNAVGIVQRVTLDLFFGHRSYAFPVDRMQRLAPAFRSHRHANVFARA